MQCIGCDKCKDSCEGRHSLVNNLSAVCYIVFAYKPNHIFSQELVTLDPSKLADLVVFHFAEEVQQIISEFQVRSKQIMVSR